MPTFYSYSSLESFRSCPRQFKFAYIEKPAVERTVAADTYLGNVVHRALQRLHKFGADSILVPREDIFAFYQQEWNKIDRRLFKITSEYHTIDDYQRLGQEMLSNYYDKYQPFNQGRLLGTELNLNFALPGTDFRFRCIIDRLWRREDGRVEIIDYKTGQNITRPGDPRFIFQMGLYQLAVSSAYPDLKDVVLSQYFLRHGEKVSSEFSSDDLSLLTEQFKLAVIETKEAARLDDFPTNEGRQCDYCAYFNYCPAKKHRQLIDAETAADTGQKEQALSLKELTEQFLEKYLQSKKAKAEFEALKAKVIEAARVNNMSNLEADAGKVHVSLRPAEKFVTKSDDPRQSAELNALCRELGLDEYFALNERALMKDAYLKGRLSDEARRKLSLFVMAKEDIRVTVKLKHESSEDEDNSET